MRGKAVVTLKPKTRNRITPAYAGKRCGYTGGKHNGEDHPRLCGEKQKCRRKAEFCTGSPPPMRGKGMRTIKAFPDRRITPAYAGKSNSERISDFFLWDHPRLCGEKATRQRRKVKKIGSPPPMRGKVADAEKVTKEDRITPAYAGKSMRQG